MFTHPSTPLLRTTGVPFIYFPPYDRAQSISILAAKGPLVPVSLVKRSQNADASLTSSPEYEPNEDVAQKRSTPRQVSEDDMWLYSRFLAALWDSLAKDTDRDVVSFEELAHKLWLPFIKPIHEKTYGAKDFTRLMIAQRPLFQSEDAVNESIISSSGLNLHTTAGTATSVKGMQHKFTSP